MLHYPFDVSIRHIFIRRSVQLRMFAAKMLDVAAMRALGCSPVYMMDSIGLERDANNLLITRPSYDYENCPPASLAHAPKPTASIITP